MAAPPTPPRPSSAVGQVLSGALSPSGSQSKGAGRVWSQADYPRVAQATPLPLSPWRLGAGCLSNPPHLTSLEGPRVRVKFLSQRKQNSEILCLGGSGRQE